MDEPPQTHGSPQTPDSSSPCHEILTQQDIMQILVQHAGETIAILDRNGAYEFINVAGAKRFGITPDQVRGKSLFDFFDAAAAQRMFDGNRKILAHGKGTVTEAPHCQREGGLRWYRSSVQPLIDAKGNRTRLVVISADITESRQAWEVIKESQAITAVLLNASGDRAALCDTNGIILAVNQAGADSLQMSPQAMIGKNIWELLPENIATNRKRYVPSALAGRPVSMVDERDGTILATTIHPIPDSIGCVTRMAIFSRDITKERRAVAALEQSEHRLRDIISSLHDTALIVYDRQGVCQSIWIDPAIDGRVGTHKSRHCAGKSVFEILPAEAAARRMVLIEAAFAHGQSGRDEYDTPEGQVFETSIAPMRDATGAVTAVVSFVLDVTKRKHAEDALRQAHNQLMTAREQERRRLSSDLHDSIGQGLIVLDMTIKNAILHCHKECPEAPKYLDQATQQCQAMIKEVRSLSHGLYPATLESFGLATSLRQLAHDCAGPMHIEVKCDGLGDGRLPPPVEIALYRIAQEAINNAIRHSRGKHLKISVGCEHDAAVMQIRDDGAGFQPDLAPQGGMGLENMKARAQALGGQLTIDSRPGATRITARIPTGQQKEAGDRGP